ncbi:MAG: cupin domain-containing protein [Phycisphaeraceae bacterium]|nr:cupin domain-containing protein [Phycisphaeraceae bacterium]
MITGRCLDDFEPAEIVRLLRLTPHDEGGYFRQTYESSWTTPVSGRDGATRVGMNTIYYLLTEDRPIGRLHRNRSDIVHYFHGGSPLTYILVSPEGVLETRTLGRDPSRLESLQLVVPGGTWKATHLHAGRFGLLSEVVAPGFDMRDRELASPEETRRRFPSLWNRLSLYVSQHAAS